MVETLTKLNESSRDIIGSAPPPPKAKFNGAVEMCACVLCMYVGRVCCVYVSSSLRDVCMVIYVW